VEQIIIEHKRIMALSIKNTRSGKRCYVWQHPQYAKRK
jgi:hypothetical protein